MKIKTIARSFQWVGEFDNLVNAAMKEGWKLVKREVIPGSPNDYARAYAELVQLDPPAEPEPIDPLDLLCQIRAVCLTTPADDCQTGRCPLYGWCQQLRDGGDPTDWILPKREADA